MRLKCELNHERILKFKKKNMTHTPSRPKKKHNKKKTDKQTNSQSGVSFSVSESIYGTC